MRSYASTSSASLSSALILDMKGGVDAPLRLPNRPDAELVVE
jgi:hypothetical protein